MDGSESSVDSEILESLSIVLRRRILFLSSLRDGHIVISWKAVRPKHIPLGQAFSGKLQCKAQTRTAISAVGKEWDIEMMHKGEVSCTRTDALFLPVHLTLQTEPVLLCTHTILLSKEIANILKNAGQDPRPRHRLPRGCRPRCCLSGPADLPGGLLGAVLAVRRQQHPGANLSCPAEYAAFRFTRMFIWDTNSIVRLDECQKGIC